MSEALLAEKVALLSGKKTQDLSAGNLFVLARYYAWRLHEIDGPAYEPIAFSGRASAERDRCLPMHQMLTRALADVDAQLNRT